MLDAGNMPFLKNFPDIEPVGKETNEEKLIDASNQEESKSAVKEDKSVISVERKSCIIEELKVIPVLMQDPKFEKVENKSEQPENSLSPELIKCFNTNI